MLSDSFCSSPWYHILIGSNGQMYYCRWSDRYASMPNANDNIKTMSMNEYMNSSYMRNLRMELLAGKHYAHCINCYNQDIVNKVSGRAKQLIKTGILPKHFDRSLASSPYYDYFEYSMMNSGYTNAKLADLQVDLGNICNSSCIYCPPQSSSRVYTDHKTLGWLPNDIMPMSSYNWSSDSAVLAKFIDELLTLDELRYIHFIGGETLYMESFYTICDNMVRSNMSKRVIMGLTTNGTIYDSRIADIFKQFKSVHLGISMDCPTKLNDYVRYPSDISIVLDNINQYKLLNDNVQLQIRPTPTALSIYHYPELIEWLLVNDLHSEVCHFIKNPSWLQLCLLPYDIRHNIINRIQLILAKYNLPNDESIVINTRMPEFRHRTIANDAYGYINYLNTIPEATDIERMTLVSKLMAYESLRKNSILDYLPEYEEFLRRYNYCN